MRILITGSTGLLGQALIHQVPSALDVVGIYDPKEQITSAISTSDSFAADITTARAVAEIMVRTKPAVVIHAAAAGSVNWCEEHQAEAHAINVEGTQHIIAGCQAVGARLVYISSNAVFDGAHAPYQEDDLVGPVNYYGRTKVAAEQLVQASGVAYTIIRPTLMYGWPPKGGRDNQVTRVIAALNQQQLIEVVDDIYFNPLYTLAAAEAIWQTVSRDDIALLHIGGANRASLYELAVQTAEVFDLDATLIKPVSADAFVDAAPRAKDTTFTTTRMVKTLGISPLSIHIGLTHMRNSATLKVSGMTHP